MKGVLIYLGVLIIALKTDLFRDTDGWSCLILKINFISKLWWNEDWYVDIHATPNCCQTILFCFDIILETQKKKIKN